MDTYTPGPWEVSKHGTPDYAPQYGIYADSSPRDHAMAMGDNAEANARLIAAAPELLEACKAAEKFGEGHPDRTPGWHDARIAVQITLRAAITKAVDAA